MARKHPFQRINWSPLLNEDPILPPLFILFTAMYFVEFHGNRRVLVSLSGKVGEVTEIEPYFCTWMKLAR